MPHGPSRRLLAALITAVLLGPAFLVGAWSRSAASISADPIPAPPRSWPLFGGTPQRNMVNTVDRGIPSDWNVKAGKNIKWQVDLGSRAYGGPVVAGGRIFVGTNNHKPRNPKVKGDRGILMCFNEADGKFLWQAVHEKLASGQVNDWPNEGIASAPAVDGNRLYYVSNRCELVCADVEGNTETGEAKIVWRLDMMKELGVFPHNLAACAPLVAGDLVYTVTGNGVDEEHVNLPAPRAPSFLAVDRRTGKVVWKDNSPSARVAALRSDPDKAHTLAKRGESIMHGQWGHPAYTVVQGKPLVLFPGGDGWLYAFAAGTGELVWKFDANPKDCKYELGGRGIRSDFICAPVIVGTRCFIGTGQDPEHHEGLGHLWCIDITRTGDISLDLVTDDTVEPRKTKPNPNSGVVWHYGGPTTKKDLERIGRNYYFGRTLSTMCVHDGLVYAAEMAGYLHCLDARTGKLYWVHDIKGAVWASPLWVDDKVYIPTEDGEVWVFAHGREKVLLARVEMDQAIRTTPVAVNGTLYVMTESKLIAVGK